MASRDLDECVQKIGNTFWERAKWRPTGYGVPSDNPAQTWEEMVAVEPLLAKLEEKIKSEEKGGPGYCANRAWYGPGNYRSILSSLVGYSACDPRLRTEKCYDIAYDRLYAALPDCWHKGNY